MADGVSCLNCQTCGPYLWAPPPRVQVLQASFATFAHNITANWCCRDEPYIAKGMAKKVKLAMEW